jgi:high-affinity Fe2+/Pb2+ permease
MKNKIIATILTLLVIGGIVASTVNETARAIGVFIAAGILLGILSTILGFCIYQLVKIVSGEED